MHIFIYIRLQVGKYKDDTWLGTTAPTNRTSSVEGEWPVSYHGTRLNFAKSIGKDGYEIR